MERKRNYFLREKSVMNREHYYGETEDIFLANEVRSTTSEEGNKKKKV